MYSIIILRENAAVKQTVLPSGKTKLHISLFLEKTKQIRHLKILGKNDASQLKLMRYDFFAYHSDR